MSRYVLIDPPSSFAPLAEMESFLVQLRDETPEEQRNNPEVIEAIRQLEEMIEERKKHDI